MNVLNIEKMVEEALLKLKLEITDPFTSSQCGYPEMEGYCRRRRLLNHLKPENIESDEELQKVFLKGYFTELAYKHIIREIFQEKVFTKVTWKLKMDDIYIRVDPDIWIPQRNQIIEIKAVKKIPEEPYIHHKVQVGLQIIACPRKNPNAEIHYIEFEGRKWNMKVFKVDPLTNEDFEKIKEENKIVKTYWDKKEIPPIPDGFEKTKYPCFITRFNRCPHWDECWLPEQAIKIEAPDLENYYNIIQKIRELNKEIEKLEAEKKKYEELFPKEEGKYEIGDFELKVYIIPETIVPSYKRDKYYKFSIKRKKEVNDGSIL